MASLCVYKVWMYTYHGFSGNNAPLIYKCPLYTRPIYWWSTLLALSEPIDYYHYSDAIMSAMASQINGISIVHLSVCSGEETSKLHVTGLHRRPANSRHKGPVTRKIFPFDDGIVCNHYTEKNDQDSPYYSLVGLKYGSLIYASVLCSADYMSVSSLTLHFRVSEMSLIGIGKTDHNEATKKSTFYFGCSLNILDTHSIFGTIKVSGGITKSPQISSYNLQDDIYIYIYMYIYIQQDKGKRCCLCLPHSCLSGSIAKIGHKYHLAIFKIIQYLWPTFCDTTGLTRLW